jgi:AraC-like DNA-binding protein
MVDQINRKSIDTLNQTQSIFASIHSLLLPSFIQFSFEPSIEKLLYEKDLNINDVAPALFHMNRTMAFYPWIHSIYIYNKNANRVFSTVSGSEDTYITDLNLFKLLENTEKDDLFRYIPRQLQTGIISENKQSLIGYAENKVFTLLIGDVFSRPDEIKGWIILNLREDKIRQDFMPNYSTTGSELMIVRDDGLVFSHPDPKVFNTHLSDDPVIAHVLESAEKNGSFIENTEDERYLISFVYFDKLDWFFISKTPYENIFYKIRSIRNLSLLVFLSLVTLAGVLTLLISRKLYNPIQRLYRYAVSVKNNIKFEQAEQPEGGASELQYLDNVLKQVVRKVNTLNNYIKSHEDLYVQETLKGLVKGSIDPKEELQGSDLPDVLFNNEKLILVVLRLDNYQQFLENFDSDDIRTIFKLVNTIAQEKIGSSFLHVDMGIDHSVLILSKENDGPDERFQLICEENVKALQGEIQQRFARTISAGFSESFSDYSDLPQAYNQALSASQYRFRYGHNSAIWFQDSIGADQDTYEFPEEKVRLLLYEIRKGDIDEGLDILDEIIEEVRQFTYEDFSVMVQLFKYMFAKMLHSKGVFTNYQLAESRSILEHLNGSETIDAVRRLLEQYFRLYIEGLNSNQERKKRETVENLVQYIHDNISDPNLNPDTIAEKAELSTNYVRCLVKEILGVTLSNYLTEERLRVSKQLLLDTDNTVKEIFKIAGFTNYSNFFTTFKRHTGLTPLEYRENHNHDYVVRNDHHSPLPK